MSMIDSQTRPWSRWHRAAAAPAVDTDMRRLYERLDAQVAQRGPVCWVSGRCCQFDAYGHLLFVTGLEAAWVLRQTAQRPNATHEPNRHTKPSPTFVADQVTEPARADGACPFQLNRLCSVHTVRPMGCRVFFCQHGTEDWQHELYERFLAELRGLHDDHELPYYYMEWRQALREAREALRSN